MKRKIIRGFFAAALLAVLASSVTGCYDYDDHWHGRDGYYGHYYGYRNGHDRDDWWRGRWHDHDRDND